MGGGTKLKRNMKLFAVLALALADPIPFDAAAICCDSLIVKGFDPVEGTYLLDTLAHHSRAQYKRAAEGDSPAGSLFYSYMPMFGSFPNSRQPARGAWVFGDHEHENDMKLRASLQSEELCPAQLDGGVWMSFDDVDSWQKTEISIICG